jgi:hypothetical protein
MGDGQGGAEHCHACGVVLQAGSNFCANCGASRASTSTATSTSPPPSRRNVFDVFGLTPRAWEEAEREAECAPATQSAPPAQGGASPPPRATGGGFALWNGDTFVGFGIVGAIVAAVLFFTHSGPFHQADAPCVITAIGGNKLCGDDAKAWCDSTDQLRAMDPTQSASSQAACDSIRGR